MTIIPTGPASFEPPPDQGGTDNSYHFVSLCIQCSEFYELTGKVKRLPRGTFVYAMCPNNHYVEKTL